ncbi:hypothetical protein [Acinetobacter sp. 226]|uniref:hypothetical protein n=1 Tax=Acinetobacter sp. 226 TaxID=3114699 RepID=UPI003A8ABF54
MNIFLVLSGILSFVVWSHTAFAANCTITADASTVNLNLATSSVRTNVYFKNCINRVRPSFQWTNTIGNNGAFYLNNQASTSIPVPFYARIGGEWDNTNPIVGASQSAAPASINFDRFFSSSVTTKNLTMYTQFSLADFEDLSKYPAGTYKTSLIFNANEF